MELTKAQIADLSCLDDPIRAFLNAYTLCEPKGTEILNLLRTREFDYSQQSSELLRALDSDSPPQLSWVGDDQILIQGAALTRALSQHIASKHSHVLSAHYSEPYRTSDSFGAVPYWLSLDCSSPLTATIHRLPRDRHQLHMTFQRFHKPLVVTPGHLGEWTLTRIPSNRALENHLERRLREREFRVAVSSLSSDADVSGESHPRSSPLPPHEFHLTSIGPIEQQAEALRHVLDRAYERRAAILVLPELRMPPPLLEAVRDFLRRQTLTAKRGFLLVAAGSWHLDMPGGPRYNRCVVLRHDGEDLWSHDKLREYEINPQNVADNPDAYRAIGVGPGGAVEAIHRGQTLQFYDSIAGRLAAAICVGFFSPDVHPLLLASAANLFLVPAMTTSITVMEACTTDLVHTQLAYSLVANCGHFGSQAPSFCQWPAAHNNIRRLAAGKVLLTLDLNNTSIYDVD
jgi:predicted amidohydrolase